MELATLPCPRIVELPGMKQGRSYGVSRACAKDDGAHRPISGTCTTSANRAKNQGVLGNVPYLSFAGRMEIKNWTVLYAFST